MPTFIYQARDNTTNKTVSGSLKADSERMAGKTLLEQGLIPSSIKEESEAGSFFAKFTDRITLKDKLIFTRQLSTLISAGLPLAQGLYTVFEQTVNKKLKAVVGDIISSVEAGHTLADSFSKYPDVFDKLYLALIKSGEASGTLDESMQRIANQQEKDAQMMSKIKGALTYPLIVLLVISAVVGFMLFTVVPQVKTLYEDMNQELPFLTMIMVTITDVLIKFWWLLLMGLIAGGYFFSQWLKTDSGRATMDKFKLNVPVFKKMFRKLYMARFTRTAQTLLISGVPMLDMLDISAEAVNNLTIEKGIRAASEKVKSGKPLSASLKEQDYVLPLVPQMISIGEQSGRIDEMMGKTAQVYEDELDDEIKAISTAIEPILMLVLGVVAGGMVGAILLPIYSLVNTVQM